MSFSNEGLSMRYSFWLMLLLGLVASVAVGAQPSEKKEAASTVQDKKNAADEGSQPADEKAATDDKSAKKTGRKVPLKLTTANEAELIKTLSYMQGFGQGHEMFMQSKDQGIQLDVDLAVQAFRDGLEGK